MYVNRRGFLKAFGHVLLGSFFTVGAGYYYSTKIEPEKLTVEQLQIPLKNLSPALEGFKIVQLTDLHLHPYTQIDFVAQAVDTANSLDPDLVVLTGDYVLQGAESIFELAPVLGALNATYGVFASLGNHDYWTDVQVIRQGLAEAGVPVLRNQGLELAVGKSSIFLAGLDDVWSGTPDLRATLDSLSGNIPAILLTHEPDWADNTSQNGRISLQLSGHTHGGQVRLPGLGAPLLPPFGLKYDQGLHRVNEMWVYTSRGIGVIGPPVRLNCPPEVTEITLLKL